MERAALDRWGRGDTQGALDLCAEDITYFDPLQNKRVDGLAAMKTLYDALAGKIKIQHFDMIDPKVQRTGDAAVLTYNLVDEVVQLPTGPTNMKLHWNVTSVYARVGSQWKIIHSHFSYVKGQVSAEAR
jgi:ketosteroid isomerase-like protein